MNKLLRIRDLPVSWQLSLFSVIFVVAIFAALIGFVTWQTSTQAIESTERNLHQQVAFAKQVMKSSYDRSMKSVERFSNLFSASFPDGLSLDESQQVRVGQYESPALLHRGRLVNLDHTIPDRFTKLAGGVATVFVRHQDDFLRVSTSLLKEDGSRALGTLLGASHPAFDLLMRGEPYVGKARLFGRDYLTKYLPLRADNRTFAVLFVGLELTDVFANLKRGLTSLQVGETGYFFAMRADEGPAQGELVMHPSLEGENLLSLKDASGATVFGPLMESEQGLLTYLWPKDGYAKPQEKILAFQYVPGWDWVVGGGSYVAEFTRDSIQLRNRLMVFAALAGALLVGLLFWFNRSRLAPLTDLSRALGRLGEGDLRVAFAAADEGASDSGNEIRALGAQARGTLHNLRQLIMHIRDEAGRLDEVIGQLRVLMSSTDGQMDEQLTQAEQLASAITQLGASAEEITRNTHDTSGAAASARQSAASGRETIDSLATEIERVTTNLAGAGEIVETLNGDAERIGKVLDVIRGIADQTNLLALNAAIEAARAGEQGRGFSVVADEVRQLALRTQESTAEIQQMIASLQGSATRAVGSMREMRELTASLETSARSTNETFGGILDAIHRVDEMSTQISAALTEQLAVVEELQQRVVVVRDGAQQSAGEMRKGLDRAQALEAVSQSLQQQIGTFRLP